MGHFQQYHLIYARFKRNMLVTPYRLAQLVENFQLPHLQNMHIISKIKQIMNIKNKLAARTDPEFYLKAEQCR